MRLAIGTCALAMGASAARADDATEAANQVVRAALVDRTYYDSSKPSVFIAAGAHLSSSPGGPALATRTDPPIAVRVLARQDDARLVELPTFGVRLTLWIGADQLAPVVARETGVAASPTAALPGPGGDGWFVETGVLADGERRGDRIHVAYQATDRKVEGWIAASALGVEFTDDPGFGDDWTVAPTGTQITVRGAVLATSTHGDLMRKLSHGRGELGGDGWRARGKMIVAKAGADGEDEGVAGGVVGGAVGGGAGPSPIVPVGACLYDGRGVLVGLVEVPGVLALRRAGDRVEVTIAVTGGSKVTLFTRGAGKAIELCSDD